MAESTAAAARADITEPLRLALGTTERSLDLATERAVGWRKLPADSDWRSIIALDRVPAGSFSHGTVGDGTLLNSAELPVQGEFHSVIERHRKYETRWATQEMVTLIEDSAKYVHMAEGGAPLRVGNMSKRKGGDIRWSRSHNSGRDADLAFYVVTADTGESIPAPDLLSFDENGIPSSRTDLRFDVARNWRLVEALLTQTAVNVQWLFVSIPLEALLIQQARAIGASEEIIRRASEVLHQPTDARPHADHFHLRLGCSRDDRLDGCLDYGPQWDWLDWHRTALLARSLSVAASFREGNSAEKKRSLEFLDGIKSPFAADVAGVWGLWDPAEDVRDTALSVTGDQFAWSANALVQVQKFIQASGTSPGQTQKAYSVLRRSRDPIARDFALERLTNEALSPRERTLAAAALGHFMEPELVAPLLEALNGAPAPVRVEVAEVLHRITNRSENVDWANATPAAVTQGIERWRKWWEQHQGEPRELWLANGFAQAGVKVERAVGPEQIDGLLKLLTSKHSYLRYNANRSIRELTGRWAPLEQEDGTALLKYWDKWWAKNRERVLVGEIGPDA